MPLAARPEVIVRRARTEDWRALRELRLKALRSDPQAFGSMLEVKLAYPDSRWRELAQKGAESSGFATWVAASSDGRLVGMAVVALLEGSENVLGMWVERRFRRHGVGGQLLDRAVAWARESDPAGPLRLEVNPKQVEAVRLYESRGFHFTGSGRPLGCSSSQEVVREMVLAVKARSSPVNPAAPKMAVGLSG